MKELQSEISVKPEAGLKVADRQNHMANCKSRVTRHVHFPTGEESSLCPRYTYIHVTPGPWSRKNVALAAGGTWRSTQRLLQPTIDQAHLRARSRRLRVPR